MDSKSNKKSEIVYLIIGVVLFIVISVIQNNLTRQGTTQLNGIFAQVQVIISTLIVILSHKKGYIAGVIVNILSIFPVLIQIIKMKNIAAIPGVVIPVCTIITITIIYVFSSKTRKMNNELTESYNQIVEANRLMKDKDEKLTYLAYYDVLTNMPNRQLFINKLEENIENDTAFTVIYADIDDFKKINDVHGHNSGDIMLCSFAERFRNICGDRDFVGRIGGDEFAIMLKGNYSDVQVNNYINKLRSIISEPVAINGALFHLTMSYGVASFPTDGRTSEDMFKCIDIAMFNAKAGGKDRPCFYNRIQQTAR